MVDYFFPCFLFLYFSRLFLSVGVPPMGCNDLFDEAKYVFGKAPTQKRVRGM